MQELKGTVFNLKRISAVAYIGNATIDYAHYYIYHLPNGRYFGMLKFFVKTDKAVNIEYRTVSGAFDAPTPFESIEAAKPWILDELKNFSEQELGISW